MSLTTLADTLRAQAKANNRIVLDSSVLSSASVLDDIRTAFVLGDGNDLTITGVAESDIPDPAGGSLTISSSTASASVLNRQNVGIALVFTMPSTTIEAVITASMGTGFHFSDSFAGLDTFPFDALAPTDPTFVYTTSSEPAYEWPKNSHTTVALPQPGLYFFSQIDVGSFSLIGEVLHELAPTKPLSFYGPFAPTPGQPLPIGRLEAKLTPGPFTVGDLHLGAPVIGLQITQAPSSMELQRLDLLIGAVFGQNELEVDIAVPMAGDTFALIAAPPVGSSFSVKDLVEALPGGKGFETYIPQELDAIFANIGLDYFSMIFQPSKVNGLGFKISTLNPWKLIEGVLELDKLSLQISIIDPAGMNLANIVIGAEAEFFPKIFPGSFDFTVALEKQMPKWLVSTVSGRYAGMVNLGTLVGGLLSSQDSVPEVLSDIQFSDFGLSATRTGVGQPFTYAFSGSAEAAFSMLGTQLAAQAYVGVTKTASGHDIDLAGGLVIGEESFSLKLDLGTAGSLLTTYWETEGNPLGFDDIASGFGFDLPTIPEGLDLGLESAGFSYDFKKKIVALEADSVHGKAAFVALKPASSQNYQYFFGFETGSPINLSNLPLIKWALPSGDSLSIQNIRVIISSAAVDSTTAGEFEQVIDQLGVGYPEPPAAGMSAGVGFSMEVGIAGFSIPIALGTDTPAQGGGGTQAPQPPAAPPPRSVTTPPARGSDGVTWLNIQKTFGPVSVEKVGVKYQDGEIFVLSNLSLTASGLTIGLIEFGIHNPIKTFSPGLTIRGIDISFSAGPVEISGGLIGTLDPLSFTGELIIAAEVLTIAAVGGYAEVEGHPSFFLFAVLDYPIGGPSCFFITGLAAGFGFNRSLVIPPIDGVATFPFVEWATGGAGTPSPQDSANDVLAKLAQTGVVAPQLGEDWLAAGIRFTSFEVVDSFALVTVSFGREFEVDLLGLSTLQIPKGAPVAEVQLEIKVSVKPSEGVFSLEGQLTRNSYVLSPDARLTGGFAFYLWFGGEHAGDFVITLGGYSPRFDVPDYYPKVPRLGLNWQLSDLTIQGDLYFALTSNAVMAGGGLSAVWQSGPIKAWFDVEADFLLVFKPFHYYITAGIHLGASFTINLLITKISITIHLGVDLAVWGPPFQGKATVDLDIISFTIHFGSGGADSDTTIGWDDFVKTLLPQKQPPKTESPTPVHANIMAVGAPETDPVANADVVSTKIIGLTKTVKSASGVLYVVNPKKFEVETHSVIPSNADPVFPTGSNNVPIVLDKSQMVSTDGKPLAPADVTTNFGIGPTGTAPSELSSVQSIVLQAEEAGEAIKAYPIIGNVPKALWEQKHFSDHGVPSLGSDAIKDSTFKNVVTGFRLVPQEPKEDHTLPIELQYLQFTIDENIQGFAWSAPFVPTTDSFSSTDTVQTTIGAPLADKNRDALLKAIPKGLLASDPEVDVSSLSTPADSYLRSEPAYRLLGESKV